MGNKILKLNFFSVILNFGRHLEKPFTTVATVFFFFRFRPFLSSRTFFEFKDIFEFQEIF